MKTVISMCLVFGLAMILLGIPTHSLAAKEKPDIAMTMSDCGDAGGKVILKDNEFRDQGIWYCDIEASTRFQCVGQATNEANCHLNDESKSPRNRGTSAGNR